MPGETSTTLFSPGRIGPLGLKNRVIMAPMTTRKSDAQGHVTDSAIAYYRARAQGGVGLITVEMAAPEKVGKHRNFELGLCDDRFLPGLTRLAAAIHEAGAKAAIQLGHGGGHTRIDIAGETPIAPSAIPHSVQEGHTEVIVPEEMTRERIARTRQAFAEAAVRAARAGFDAVEIHAAHGYLISQFLTPAENLRDDLYGGSLENRARFALEITRAVKDAVPGLAVIFRMNGDDFFDGGMIPDEAVEVAVWAAEAGADAIHMTGGHYRSQPTAAIMIPPMATAPTPFAGFAQAVKRRVDVPVISVGRFGDPAAAQAALAAGTADFIALGRPLLADPDWVEKARAGEEVRRCLACNTCVDFMRAGRELHCLVNPMTGRELALAGREPVRRGERIAVIGAGPAGLSYASLMAPANQVTLFERAAQAGGAYRLAGLAPLFQGVAAAQDSLDAFIEALARICTSRGVTIRTGADPIADPSLLAGFDHVVIATGARYLAGATGIVEAMLRGGWARKAPFERLARDERVRGWFYHRARRATGEAARARLKGVRSIEVIGDAASAGKSEQAIISAFEAALGPLDKRPADVQRTARDVSREGLEPVP
jgi:2,4-dienoyl-CoA reductase-like NADH-dependent reductase (Old Yellow Enzyme family)